MIRPGTDDRNGSESGCEPAADRTLPARLQRAFGGAPLGRSDPSGSAALRIRTASSRRYGSLRWEQVIFREELERRRRRLDLRVVHVLTDPPEDWTGETGLIDAALLARHLPSDAPRADVFPCGPRRCTPPRWPA